MLVDGAVAVSTAGVTEVSSHRSLEKAFAALASELAIVLATGLISAHHAVHVGDLVPGKSIVSRGGTIGGSRCPALLLTANLELGSGIRRNVLLPLVYYHCHAILNTLVNPQIESDSVARGGDKDPF